MNKKLYMLSAFLVIFGYNAQAQILFPDQQQNRITQNTNAANQKDDDALQYSPQFLQSLRSCRKYKENNIVQIEGKKVRQINEILGLGRGNICRVRIISSYDNGYLSTNCAFNPQNLAKYVSIMEKFARAKNPANAVSKQEMSEFGEIVSNKNICSINIVYDETKELRQKLSKCIPYQQVFGNSQAKMVFNIMGRQNNSCLAKYVIESNRPPLKALEAGQKDAKPVPTKLYYDCLLSGYSIEELKLAFEQDAINSSNPTELLSDESSKIFGLLNKFLDKGTCKITDIKQ